MTSKNADMRHAKLRELFKIIDASDWEAFADLLHPDVVYERPGYPPLTGLERVLRFYRSERIVASGTHEIYGIVVEGDAAACWGRVRATLQDGVTADEQFAEVYSFEGEKIKTRRSYFFRPAI